MNFAAGEYQLRLTLHLLMNLGCDGIFVGSGVFISLIPWKCKGDLSGYTNFNDPKIVMEAQKMVDERKSMLGLDTKNLDLKMQERGPSL